MYHSIIACEVKWALQRKIVAISEGKGKSKREGESECEG